MVGSENSSAVVSGFGSVARELMSVSGEPGSLDESDADGGVDGDWAGALGVGVGDESAGVSAFGSSVSSAIPTPPTASRSSSVTPAATASRAPRRFRGGSGGSSPYLDGPYPGAPGGPYADGTPYAGIAVVGFPATGGGPYGDPGPGGGAYGAGCPSGGAYEGCAGGAAYGDGPP